MRKLFQLLGFLLFLPSLAFGADGESRFETIFINNRVVHGAGQTGFQVASSTSAIEQIYTAPETGTVTKVCYAMNARTGTPPTYKIGIETVSTTTGRASGTYKTGTGECSATFTPPATTAEDNTIQCKTLTGTTCSVTVGEILALTIKHSAGTVDASNASTFHYKFNSDQQGYEGQNSLFTVLTGTATRSLGYQHNAMFYGNATRYWGNSGVAIRQDSYNGTNEKGMKFTRPGPAGQTYKCAGVRVCHAQPSTSDTIVVKLYNGTTALGTHTSDTDQREQGFDPTCTSYYWDEGPQTLTFGSSYNIGVTFTTNSKFINTMDVYNNAYLDAWPWGVTTYGITRATQGATAFTDQTTYRPHMDLITDSIVGGASGGVLRATDMNGGMN